MHVGAVMIFEGTAPAYDRPRRPRALAPAPRAALPPEARLPARRDRPPAVDRRCQLQPRVPRARHRAAGARARRRSCARSPRACTRRRSTAPSRCGRCGSCTGSRAAASRSSPRPTTRSSTASRASTSRRCCSTSRRSRRRSRTPTAPGRRSRRRAASTWPRAACAGSWRSRSARRRAWSARRAAPARRCRRRARRSRGSARSCGPGMNPAPETPLNVEIGPHRRLVWVRQELADFKRVKNALGGTVNDVVLATVAGALQKWLRSRGVRTEGLELRALVPVSIRARDEHHQLGNRIAAMRGPLPVYVEDPVARLQVVRQAMDGLKDSKQALGAEVLAGMQALAPPTIFAQASRLNFSTRLFNLLVTNVPGPQLPLYVLGRRLRGPVPRRLPAQAPRARRGDHVLRRRDGLRAARRLRRDARPRADRRAARREPAGAAGGGDAAAGGGEREAAASSRARTSRPRTSSRATTEA